MRGIKDSIAIVTGGARGLGKAMVERLAGDGAYVIIADVLVDEGKNTAQEFCDKGYKVEFRQANLLVKEEIDKLIDGIVADHGRIDILVNNAGIQIRKMAVDFTEADWDKLFGINLKAVFFASQAAARHMIKAGKGKIVCISSENSARYTSGRALYGIAKCGVNGLVGNLGLEWARYGIRVNAVAPGFIDTEMHRTAVAQGVLNREELLSVLPNKRLLDSAEIADAVCFLASDESSGMVGQVIFVDGGCNKSCLPEARDFTMKA